MTELRIVFDGLPGPESDRFIYRYKGIRNDSIH